jgi:hypothetical protein
MSPDPASNTQLHMAVTVRGFEKAGSSMPCTNMKPILNGEFHMF